MTDLTSNPPGARPDGTAPGAEDLFEPPGARNRPVPSPAQGRPSRTQLGDEPFRSDQDVPGAGRPQPDEDCGSQGVRKRNREATERRLLDAARDLFGEHGYDGVTVRMIAAAAGANVALVNRYFGSKAALFEHVLAGESALREV
ncbi:helix-turn-helix domain-containing protein, partial [Spirillospora sp. NPDC049652]